jgi:hypothetical protein
VMKTWRALDQWVSLVAKYSRALWASQALAVWGRQDDLLAARRATAQTPLPGGEAPPGEASSGDDGAWKMVTGDDQTPAERRGRGGEKP